MLSISSKYKSKVHFIKYEDLVSNARQEMTKVLNFLNLEIDENCFRTDRNNIEANRNELWKNLSEPIIKNNFNSRI